MLNTVTSVTCRYRDHVVVGRRWVDSINGKFSCWQGCIDEDTERAVVAKTVQQFEKQFILQVDAMELEDTLATAEPVASEGTSDTP